METTATTKTEQNIKVIQQTFAEFSQGNIQAIANACTDKVVWGSFENKTVPYAGKFHGNQGVLDFFTRIATSIDFTDFHTKEFFGVDDKVFVKGYHAANVKSTGKTFGHDFLMEFTLEDGKISYFFAYIDTRDQTAAFAGN